MGRSIEKKVEKQQLQYKKIGGGSARLVLSGRRKIIKPNQRFFAFPEEIPAGFKDTIILLEGQAAPAAASKGKQEPVEKVFKVRVRPKNDEDPDPGVNKKGKAKKWYNVVNKDNDKVMNPEALTQAEARKLADSLNA